MVSSASVVARRPARRRLGVAGAVVGSGCRRIGAPSVRRRRRGSAWSRRSRPAPEAARRRGVRTASSLGSTSRGAAPESSAVTGRSLSDPCALPFRSARGPVTADRLNDTAGVLWLTPQSALTEWRHRRRSAPGGAGAAAPTVVPGCRTGAGARRHRSRRRPYAAGRRWTMSPAPTGSLHAVRRGQDQPAVAVDRHRLAGDRRSPGSSARTARPSVAQPAAYASWRPLAAGSPPAARHAPVPVLQRAQHGPQQRVAVGGDRRPPGPGSPRWARAARPRARVTLRPMPMTTPSARRARRGCRRPCVPRRPTVTSRSLGHLRAVSTPAARDSAVAAATPVSSGSQPQRSTGTAGRVQQHGEEQAGAGGRRPAAVQAAAAGGLLLGDQDRALGLALGRAGRQVGVGGAGGGDDVQRGPQPAGPHQRAAQRRGVQRRPVQVGPAAGVVPVV